MLASVSRDFLYRLNHKSSVRLNKGALVKTSRVIHEISSVSINPVLKMNRQGKILTQFAFLVTLACFMYPSLLYKSIWGGSSREARWIDLKHNETLRQQLGSNSAPSLNLNCVEPSIDDFPNDFMTQDKRQKHGGVVVHVLLAIYMFVALAFVCDGYFIPSLKELIKKFHLHIDVGGTTLMAAGSSAPEFFTSFIGVFITESDIGLGTIVGSAVFNLLFVTAVCGLFAGCVLHLTPWPLLRDCVCYILSIAALVAVTYDQVVYWYEGALLVSMYLLYLVIMYFNTSLEGYFKRLTGIKEGDTDVESNDRGSDEKKSLLKSQYEDDKEKLNPSVQIIDESDDSPFSVPEGFVSQVLWILTLPISCLFYITIPNWCSNRWEKWYLISFLVSVVWIALLTYVLVWMVLIIGFTIGIPDVVMGLTFLAAGNSMADGISSLIVARQGNGDMAVANAVRSNIFDILLCLGLPWLLKTTAVDFGGYIVVLSGSIIYSSFFLFGTVFAVIFLLMLSKWYLNKCIALAFLILYLAFTSVATLLGLNLLGAVNLPTC